MIMRKPSVIRISKEEDLQDYKDMKNGLMFEFMKK